MFPLPESKEHSNLLARSYQSDQRNGLCLKTLALKFFELGDTGDKVIAVRELKSKQSDLDRSDVDLPSDLPGSLFISAQDSSQFFLHIIYLKYNKPKSRTWFSIAFDKYLLEQIMHLTTLFPSRSKGR